MIFLVSHRLNRAVEVYEEICRIELLQILALHRRIYRSGELAGVKSDILEMLDGTRPMTRDEEAALGELAQAWRKLAVPK